MKTLKDKLKAHIKTLPNQRIELDKLTNLDIKVVDNKIDFNTITKEKLDTLILKNKGG